MNKKSKKELLALETRKLLNSELIKIKGGKRIGEITEENPNGCYACDAGCIRRS